MSRWFRHYAGMMRDDKLVRVAIRAGQTIERVVWIWGAILESASEIDDNGKYDLDAPEIAYFLRADLSDVEAILSALQASGRIDADNVVKWSNRQFSSDTSAERQRRYRDKKRAEESDVHTEGDDARVTSPSRHRDAPELETETELETDLKKEKREAVASCLRFAFPCPVGVSEDQWKAFRQQRKKALTDRAYLMICNKLVALAEAGWPPGDMIDLAIERGWETVFEPRTQPNGQSASNVASLRGARPNLTSMLRASSDLENRLGTRPALPASGNG